MTVHDRSTDASTPPHRAHDAFSASLNEIADVFSNCLVTDGATTLLQTCIDLTGAVDGTVYLDDAAGRLTVTATTHDDHTPAPSCTATDVLVTSRASTVRREPRAMSLAIPVRSRGRVIGVVELDLNTATPVDTHTLNAIQSLADVAAATIDHMRTRDHSARLVGQLQSALDQRTVLEQAKGMIAERVGIDCQTAFSEIRKTARREQRPIGEVASEIVASRSNGVTAE